jgi:hypothetical protein
LFAILLSHEGGSTLPKIILNFDYDQFNSFPTISRSKLNVFLDETKKNIAKEQDLDSLLTLLQFEQMEIRYLASEIIQGLTVTGTSLFNFKTNLFKDEGLKLSENAWSSLGLLARNVDDSTEHSDTILTEVSWTLLTLASHPGFHYLVFSTYLLECHKDFVTFVEWSTLLRLTNCDHVIIKSNICSLLGYLALNGKIETLQLPTSRRIFPDSSQELSRPSYFLWKSNASP